MRPRSLTGWPFLRAQSRIAPACSRSMRPPVARERPPPEARVPPRPTLRGGRAHRARAGGAAAGGTGAAPAPLAGGRDVPGQCVAHLLGGLVRQVDFIGRAVEGEADGLV